MARPESDHTADIFSSKPASLKDSWRRSPRWAQFSPRVVQRAGEATAGAWRRIWHEGRNSRGPLSARKNETAETGRAVTVPCSRAGRDWTFRLLPTSAGRSFRYYGWRERGSKTPARASYSGFGSSLERLFLHKPNRVRPRRKLRTTLGASSNCVFDASLPP